VKVHLGLKVEVVRKVRAGNVHNCWCHVATAVMKERRFAIGRTLEG